MTGSRRIACNDGSGRYWARTDGRKPGFAGEVCAECAQPPALGVDTRPSWVGGRIVFMRASSTLAELSYEAGVRALDLQEERGLEQLRARTGILLAASSLTATFLGAQAISHTSGIGVLGGLALLGGFSGGLRGEWDHRYALEGLDVGGANLGV
jgi:hypothetical protein